MSITTEITSTLKSTFTPTELEVVNESYKHVGHSGNTSGGSETHFKIIISEKDIAGNSRLEKHRKIMEALAEVIKKIHAIEIVLKS